MAFLVLHPEHALKWKGRHAEFEKELKDHAKGRLPGFARPEWVEIVRVLPVSYNGLVASAAILMIAQKTSTGKILKTELRNAVAKL